MNWSDIRILYGKEMRSAFRERSIVVNSVLMPILLYPVLLWAMFSALTFVQGLSEGFTSRIVVGPVPPDHAALVDSLDALENVEVERVATGVGLAEARERLGAEEVDAVLRVFPVEGRTTVFDDNFRVRVSFDRSVDRSRRARDRISEVVTRYREGLIERQADRLEIPATERQQFSVWMENVASERDMGALVLGQMIPLFLVIMVALGCFVPSVDTTAGERERGTWETTMTTAPSRLSVVTAKYLYVVTLGILAGALNVAAIFVSIGAVLQPLLGDGDQAFSFSIPLLAVPVMLVATVALALFFGAAMMLLAAFARSFKDGQAMVTPVYWLALLPLLLGNQVDRSLTPALALVPVANVAMVVREAMEGVFDLPLIALSLAVVAVLVVAVLLLARVVLQFEDFLLGSYDGSLWRFLKDRFLSRSRSRARP